MPAVLVNNAGYEPACQAATLRRGGHGEMVDPAPAPIVPAHHRPDARRAGIAPFGDQEEFGIALQFARDAGAAVGRAEVQPDVPPQRDDALVIVETEGAQAQRADLLRRHLFGCGTLAGVLVALPSHCRRRRCAKKASRKRWGCSMWDE